MIKTKVIGLVRVSTDGQAADDRGGLPRQLDVIERTVAALDLECLEVVALKGVSGTEVRRNPEIIRILSMIASKAIGGLVVADIDRIMRPALGEDYALLDPFMEAGATIYANGQSFNFRDPASKLLLTVLLSFAEFERKKILDRSRGAVRQLCLAGRHPFGPKQLPRGIVYNRDNNTWGTTDAILPVLEAFRLLDEEGINNIAELARRVGINERALHHIIRNRMYTGWKIWATGREVQKSRSRTGRYYKKKVPLAESEIIRTKVFIVPPVSEERFNRVQDVLQANMKAWKAERADRPAYNLLRSIARCERCESRLYFSQDKRRPASGGYYFCAQRYEENHSKDCSCGNANQSKASLDAAMAAFLPQVLTDPATVRAIIAHALQTAECNKAQSIPGAVPTNFAARRKRLKDGYESGIYSSADVKERLAQIETEENILKEVVLSQAESLQTPAVDQVIHQIIKGAHAINRLTDPSWKLRAIQRMFSAVYFENGQIHRFKLQPSLLKDVVVCEKDRQRGWDSSRPRA